MKVEVVLGVALMVTLAVASNGLAQPYYGWGYALGPAANPLGLTPEQITQIRAINLKWQNELVPLWTQLQTKSIEFRTLMWSPSPDPSEVTAKTEEVNELQSQIQQKALEKQSSIRNLLTDEQKTLFDQMGLSMGWGRGPCGLGLGAGFASGFGRGGGFGRGRGFSRGRGFGSGGGYGWVPGTSSFVGPGMGVTGWGMTPMGTVAPLGWGRGPCGMGLGRASWGRGRW